MQCYSNFLKPYETFQHSTKYSGNPTATEVKSFIHIIWVQVVFPKLFLSIQYLNTNQFQVYHNHIISMKTYIGNNSPTQ